MSIDRVGLRRFWEALKAALLSKRSREALVFAFFVLISALFWVIQTLNGVFDMPVRVPVELIGVPENVVLTTEPPEQLVVTVRDKGTSLIRYINGTRIRPLVVDFAKSDDGSEYGMVMIPQAEIAGEIATILSSSTSIVSIDPDTLEYSYSRGTSRRVAVVPNASIYTNSLFYLANVHCSPDTVTAWGPKNVLDTLSTVTTSFLTLNDLTETRTIDVNLQAPRGVKLDPASIQMTAEVDMFTEKTVEVPIIGTNFPAGHTLRTFPATAKVTFRVGAKQYKLITAENFVITATYEDLISLADNDKLHLRLRSLPDGVSQVRISPETVDFLIEITGDE